MAKKKQKDEVKSKEFRYNRARAGHPAYITQITIVNKNSRNKKARFIGITEHSETQGESNVPLTINPDPNNRDKEAYLRPFVDEVDLTEKTFSKKLEGWAFADEDVPKVEIIISNKKR